MKTSRANAAYPLQTRNNNRSQLRRKTVMLSLAVFSLLLMSATASAQNVEVSDSTGADGLYPTLGAAFAAINANPTQTGNNITILILGNTTEGASAVLNEATGGAWASVTITPLFSTPKTVSGAIAGPLIDLNGADNVNIDGQGALTIENTMSGPTSSTIRFIADATNNGVQLCTIKGSGTSPTQGTIFFSTGTTTGNDGNVITFSLITSSGATFPTNAIYSAGTSAAIDNSGITISTNAIADYFNAAVATVGINVSATGNSAWTITGNQLFQTALRLYTTGTTHNGINIGTGSGYTITGNTIGFANAGGTGLTTMVGNSVPLSGTFPTAWNNTGAANATRYIAINAAFTAAGAVSNIQGNTIAGFALYTSSGAATTNGIWCAINVISGNVNIGTTAGNTIGATSGQGSVYTAANTAGGAAVGIFVTSANTVSIQNNTIGAIDAAGAVVASGCGGINGIDVAGAGTFTISGNTIGNSTANNLRAGNLATGATLSNTGTFVTTTGVGAALGIRSAATGGPLNITGNTLRGFAMSSTSSSASSTFTGITNTGAATTAVNITGNFLGTAAVGLVNYAFNIGATSALTGINSSAGSAAAPFTISNNDIRGIVYSGTGANANTYISWNHAQSVADNVNSNTFTNLNVNTSGSVTFLNRGTNSMTATGSLSVSSNQIVTAFNKGTAGGTVTFFTNAGGSSSPNGSTILQNLNNFSNVTLTGITAVLCWSDADGPGGGSGPTKTISNNTFNNITTGVAQITGISFNFSGNGTTVSNNTLTNFTGGGVILALAAGTSNSGATETISGNTFSNYTAGGQVNVLQTGFGAVTTGNITGNTITNISSVSAAANPIFPMIVSGFGTTTNISKNKIGNVQSSGNALAGSVLFGILVQTAGTTYNISNNLVGDLRLPANPAANNLQGISIGTLTAATTVNLQYNTVWLNEVVNAVAGFGSSAVSASTTPTVVMQDNILVDTSVNNTTGLTVAYRRSANSLGTYGAASNNNDLYAGTPGASNLIFNDGTNSDQTIAAYKARVGPRDSASLTENPNFLSTTAANATFLHINPAVATQLESGGANVGGITDDFDGDIRQGNPGYGGSGTAPDIGADEFNGIALDLTAPLISYTTLGNDIVAASRNFANVTVTDATGVNIAPGTRPRVYFKKTSDANNTFNDNTNATVGWKFAEANGAGGSPFTFTINYSLLFGGLGVSVGDTIQYFVVAQDTVVPTPNVGINSGTFAATPTSVALTAAAFPITGTINSYNISDVISGTKTVCAAACDYNSLTNALGVFADINAKVVTGNLIIQITGDLTGETGANALNTLSESPAGSNFTVTILPTGAPHSITSTVGATNLIKLNGASRVTIDGSVGGGGSDRSLTIENIGTVTPTVVWMGSIGSSPISSNTLKNCIIRNGVNTSSAVVISDAGTVGNPGFFSNITIQNNNVQKAFVGVFANGGTAPQNGSNLVYTQNTLNSVGANAIRDVGLYMQGVNGATVSQNTVANLSNTEDENDVGIWLASGTINATVSGNTVSTLGYTGANAFAPIGINLTSVVAGTNNNVTGNSVSSITTNGSTQVRGISVSGATADLTIQRNNVQGVINTNLGTFGAYGMDISGGNNIVVKNNFVSNVTHDMSGGIAFSTTFGVFGIRVGSGSNILVDHNSVNLFGLMTGAPNTSLLSAAFALVGTGSQNCDVRNNIFANNITGGTTSIAAVSAYLPSGGTSAMNLAWNNNAYFFGTDAARQGVGQAGTTAGTNFFTTLVALAAYSSTLSPAATNDNASIASTGAVPYLTNNDLHITPAAGPVLGGGATIASITTDFDNDPRPAANRDIGADELVQAVGGVIPGGTYYNASAVGGDSLGGNVTITNVLYLNGILSTGANTLTIDCTATVNGASPTSYIIGNLKKNYCATGVKGFEVGTANAYSPVSVNVTAGTFPADFTVKAVQGPQPNVNPTTSLQRYWTLTEGGDVTANLNFNYVDPTDIAGTEANYHLIRVTGGIPVAFPNNCPTPGATQACVDTVGNQAAINDVTNFSDWTIGEISAPTAAPATISGQVTTTSGAPMPGVTMFLSGARSARTITDSNGNYRFVNIDTDNFYIVTPAIVNYHFSPANRSFSLLANMTDAVFTGALDAVITGNVIDTPEYFVRQHYLDFLGREPDAIGLTFWSDQIRSCGNDFNCLERRTINVSAAYFLSIEFKETGGLVDRLYWASYDRAPLFSEFMPDRARVARDVIVNQTGWQDLLATNKQEFLDAWVQRAAFRAAYDNLSDDGYVDTLISHTGVDFTDGERAALVSGLTDGTLSRAGVLQRVAENERFVKAKFNEAFVRMQYFGYLRRDPDDSGFHFWLNKLNEFEGNFERAEMVKAFLVSGEYRDRFRQ